MTDHAQSAPRPDGTALALIEAGVALFGRQGFAATSTREIAAKAGANVASIAYYFGSKNGLREACAREFIHRVGGVMADPPQLPDLSPQQAAEVLRRTIRKMVGFVLGSDAARDLVAFALREITEETEAADIIYRDLIMPTHARICALWGLASGQPAESEAVRLRVFSFIGQVLYFRLAGPVVTRRMGWPGYGPEAVDQVADVIVGNFNAMLRETERN
ncbi:CerR family C-terminal domain-containing protein [Sedimentimonas flavescens]|uniref:CerR family C-terminal domain-containing protein n=1 Tax=Sedimentimonas flavescens TaxID=2851012 RepID=UPI001C4A4AD5|nr:CerR family C-terminal domain-containing protein [Sedimentimonas flavescens]MBW0158154.1 CerR family C-terminal domain-containing protein [Sedimentimonas flavescens]